MACMMLLSEIRQRGRHVIGPFLGLTALVYFDYHTVQGERGLLAWWQLNKDVKQAEQTLAALQETKDGLDNRVRLLRPDHLDADMLEERARLMLNMGRDDEIVILHRHE